MKPLWLASHSVRAAQCRCTYACVEVEAMVALREPSLVPATWKCMRGRKFRRWGLALPLSPAIKHESSSTRETLVGYCFADVCSTSTDAPTLQPLPNTVQAPCNVLAHLSGPFLSTLVSRCRLRKPAS